MTTMLCPIQHICPKYQNGGKSKDEFHRAVHSCNEFLATCCEMGMQLEMFLADKPIACSLDKRNKAIATSTIT